MKIQVTDGKKVSSLFDPTEFESYNFEEVLKYLENDGLDIRKDEDGNYDISSDMGDYECDYLVVVDIQGLFYGDDDWGFFIDEPLFKFLAWGWEIGVFEDDDVLEKVRIIAEEDGVEYTTDDDYLDSLIVYRGHTLREVGELIFNKCGYKILKKDSLRNYIDFAHWLVNNYAVYDLNSDKCAPIEEMTGIYNPTPINEITSSDWIVRFE